MSVLAIMPPCLTTELHSSGGKAQDVLQLWNQCGYALIPYSYKNSAVLKPNNETAIAKHVNLLLPDAIIFVANEKDVPMNAETRSIAQEQYFQFLLSLYKNSSEKCSRQVLFAGLGPRISMSYDDGQMFFDRFFDEKGRKLNRISKNNIHILDVVSPPMGWGSWFIDNEVLPSWQAAMSVGMIGALNGLFRTENKFHFYS